MVAKVLGLRVSPKEFSYAILSSKKKNPVVIDVKSVPFPKGPKNLSHGKAHKWFFQEIKTLVETHNIDVIVVKKFEGRATKSNSHEMRIEFEGVVLFLGGEKGIPVFKKPNSTLAKDICGKGKATYLKTKLNTSVIPDFNKFKDKEKEAVICGWSGI